MACEPNGVSTRSYAVFPTGRINGLKASNVFDPEETTLREMYDTMMTDKQMTAAITEAVPVCILVLGSSKSSKRAAFQGPYPAGAASPSVRDAGAEGIIGLVAEHVFAFLASNRHHANSDTVQWHCAVTVKFVEFYDELITDLLQPGRPQPEGSDESEVLVVCRDAQGVRLQGVTSQRVCSADDVARLVQEGRLRRDRCADVHASLECASAFFEMELHHLSLDLSAEHSTQRLSKAQPGAILSDEELSQGWRCSAVSTISIVEGPSTHKLAVPRDQLILREGPTRNQSLLALGRFVDELCKPMLATHYPPPQNSPPLISLLADSIGGNCLALSLACAATNDSAEALSAILTLHEKLGRTRQFPVSLTRTHVLGLAIRYRAHTTAMLDTINGHRSEINRMRGGDNIKKPRLDDPMNLAERFNALESLLASSKHDSASARKDSIKVYKVLELLKCKYMQLAEEKADQTKALVHAEQEKLEISRALLESRLQANRAIESTKVDKYVSESSFLAIRDRVAELEMECEQLRANKRQMLIKEHKLKMELGQCRKTADELRGDSARVCTQRDASELQKKKEQDKNLELSAQLLQLVASKDSLHKSVQRQENVICQMVSNKSDEESKCKDLKMKNKELIQRVMKVKSELHGLKKAHAYVAAKLAHARVETERALLQQDKAATTVLKEREAETIETKRLIQEGLQDLYLAKDIKDQNQKRLQEEARVSDRRASELEIVLKRSEADNARSQAEISAGEERLKAVEARYRLRIDADLSAALNVCLQRSQSDADEFVRRFINLRKPLDRGCIPSYYQEFVLSCQERARQMNSDLESLRTSERRTVVRLRACLDHCRRLEEALAKHLPDMLKELRRLDRRCEYADRDSLGAARSDIEALKAERDNYCHALDRVRLQATRQHDEAISVIRGLQNALKDEQTRSDELVLELKELREADVGGEPESNGIRLNKKDIENAIISAQEPYTSALTRIEELQQNVFSTLQQTDEQRRHSPEASSPGPATAIRLFDERSNRRAHALEQLTLAREEVHKLHHDLERAVVANDVDLVFTEENLSTQTKLLVMEQANANLLRDLKAMAGNPESSVALLAEAERRCAELSYKTAALDEELQHYRDYMKKTVRRYQRAMHIAMSKLDSSHI